MTPAVHQEAHSLARLGHCWGQMGAAAPAAFLVTRGHCLEASPAGGRQEPSSWLVADTGLPEPFWLPVVGPTFPLACLSSGGPRAWRSSSKLESREGAPHRPMRPPCSQDPGGLGSPLPHLSLAPCGRMPASRPPQPTDVSPVPGLPTQICPAGRGGGGGSRGAPDAPHGGGLGSRLSGATYTVQSVPENSCLPASCSFHFN